MSTRTVDLEKVDAGRAAHSVVTTPYGRWPRYERAVAPQVNRKGANRCDNNA